MFSIPFVGIGLVFRWAMTLAPYSLSVGLRSALHCSLSAFCHPDPSLDSLHFVHLVYVLGNSFWRWFLGSESGTESPPRLAHVIRSIPCILYCEDACNVRRLGRGEAQGIGFPSQARIWISIGRGHLAIMIPFNSVL